MKNKNYIYHVPYLRKSIAYIIMILVYLCKIMIFGILVQNDLSGIYQIVSGVKGQKMAQNDKKFLCCIPYLKNHISYDCHLWCTCVK